MAGERPAVSVAVKPVGGDKSSRVYVLAGWERDGKVSSLTLDRRVKAVKLLLDDDSVVLITKGDDGKASHYFDLFDNREPQQQTGAQASRAAREPQRTSSGGYGPAGAGDGPDDFGGDDIPFSSLRGEWR